MSDAIDPVIHPINRLRICASLRAAGAVDGGEMGFPALRDLVSLSDASLSKQLGALERAGYVSRHREYGSSRAKDTVWVSLTPAGEEALASHVRALRQIAEPAGEN